LRRLPRSYWFAALVSWTAAIWLVIVLLLPGASARPAPCNPLSGANPDPALPMCGIDDFNVNGIMIFLLVVLWIGGIAIGAVAFVIARLANRLRRRRESPSEE
jgi:hypothetical protein